MYSTKWNYESKTVKNIETNIEIGNANIIFYGLKKLFVTLRVTAIIWGLGGAAAGKDERNRISAYLRGTNKFEMGLYCIRERTPLLEGST